MSRFSISYGDGMRPPGMWDEGSKAAYVSPEAQALVDGAYALAEHVKRIGWGLSKAMGECWNARNTATVGLVNASLDELAADGLAVPAGRLSVNRKTGRLEFVGHKLAGVFASAHELAEMSQDERGDAIAEIFGLLEG